MAKRKRKSEFVGVGCFVQAIGAALMIGSFFFGVAGGVAGFIVFIVLMIWGSRLSVKWTCGECGNKIDGDQVLICPVCKARFNGG